MPGMEFTATLEGGDDGGAFVRLPAGAADVFGTRARFPVSATFNGIAYRGSTMPVGDGTFCLGVTKAIRTAAGLTPGDTVAVVIERDESERVVDVPSDLAEALGAHPAAGARFSAMSHSHRRDYVEWILEAKRPATRRRRVTEAVERIAGGGSAP